MEQIELHVAAASDQLFLAVVGAPGAGAVAPHQLRIDAEKRLADGAGEGEVGLDVAAVEVVVEDATDPARFVANALSPAKVTSSFVLDASIKAVRALVPDYQLSLAIGKEGQNARLAAKLTGAKIDIQPDSILES